MAGSTYLDGLRRLFGLQPREQMFENQEQQILGQPTVRNAPVQPAIAPSNLQPWEIQQQQDEAERQAREARLQAELEALRNGR